MWSHFALAILALAIEMPFPLAPGAWWEYTETYTVDLDGVDASTDERTRFAVARGRRGALFIWQNGGADPASGPVEMGRGWVRLPPWTGEQGLPVPLLPGTAGPGDTDGAARWRVEDWEEVSVPAGRFRALRCAWRSPENVSLLWIAPEVGVVREEQGVPGRRPEIARMLLRWSGHRGSQRRTEP
jgi:hypothetical protein